MGLGLSALTALLLLLPGIAFVFGLNRLLSPSSPPSPFDQHFSAGLILAFAAAIALHLVGIGALQLAAGFGWVPAPAPAHALVLLAGDLKAPGADAVLLGVERHPLRIGLYFAALIALGHATGRFANRFMPERSRAGWAELLAGRTVEGGTTSALAVLTTEVTHGSATYLYSGYLDEYLIDRDGRLERVVFRGFAARRLLRDDDDAPEPEGDDTFVPAERWTEIPGEIFVLQMAGAKTVNVDFFFDEDDEVPADPTIVAA